MQGFGGKLARARRGATAAFAILSAICAGCGANSPESPLFAALYPVSCQEHTGTTATDRVVIDWTGGPNDLLDGAIAEELDFESFVLPDGQSLASNRDAFIASVEEEVSAILCSLPDAAVYVSTGEGNNEDGVTVIHVAQDSSQKSTGQIGEGQYDPCNVSHSNAAIIYGGELAELGGDFTYDEWVYVFANVIAHEIGHTLGYGHVDRIRYEDGERPLFVELMLAVHTVPEMVKPQRYLADDSNCPADSSTAKRMLDPGQTCSVAHD